MFYYYCNEVQAVRTIQRLHVRLRQLQNSFRYVANAVLDLQYSPHSKKVKAVEKEQQPQGVQPRH